MPTVISHSFVALVFGKIFAKSSSIKFWSLSIVCSVLPDIDVIPMCFDVPYAHMFGHRGFSHSILFVSLIAFIVVLTGFREIKRNSKQWWLLLLYFFFIGLSHNLLDAMTSGGLGVGLFMPFDSTRYFFPYRPIRASPFSFLRLFSSEGQRILISEFIWIWIPAIIMLVIARFFKSKRNSRSADNVTINTLDETK